MKLTFLNCSISGLFLLAGCAGSDRVTVLKADEKALLTKHVTELENRWIQTWVQKDTAAMNTLLVQGFTLSGQSDKAETRQQYLETSAMPERTLKPIILQDKKLAVYDKSAISTGKTEFAGTWKSAPFVLPVRYTFVYIREGKTWKVAAAHFSSMR